MRLNGIINVYKPTGFTSHDVVAKARGILKERRIGHTGTLDPEAEGVLPLCIGQATKAVPYLTEADKCYEAEVILGAYTTTEDATGEVVERFPVHATQKEIEEMLVRFKGNYRQVPPMYSAIKVNGVRLYELARQGITIERPSREVMIYDIQIIESLKNNRFKLRVHCSKGTYIRTLCTDIGKALGCGAYMGRLLRTQVGHFYLKDALTLQEIEAHKDEMANYIEPLETLFKEYPKLRIQSHANRLLKNGNRLTLQDVEGWESFMAEKIVRLYNQENHFVGLYKWDDSKKCLRVEKMFYSD